LFAGGVFFAASVGGVAGVADSIGGCILAALPYVILFISAGGGAGDAKMMGAIGAWVGLKGGAVALVCVAVAGALVALIWAWRDGKLRRLGISLISIIGRCIPTTSGVVGWRLPARGAAQPQPADTMPYGLAILIGTMAASACVWFAHR
jgi:prepilin signal peptidase PulO-like enzyme (type II secretory pathway)